jgi:hypothetical protein
VKRLYKSIIRAAAQTIFNASFSQFLMYFQCSCGMC